MFFLLVSVSQFIEALRVGFLFTFLAPLIFVLVLTMIKEAYDDWHRYQRDKVLNYKKYHKIDKGTGRIIEDYSKNLKVGDILYINSGERVPADCVLLYTTDKAGTVFIKTDQLDGETDWKVRRPIAFTQKEIAEHPTDYTGISHADIKCEGPTNLIYEFNGIFSI